MNDFPEAFISTERFGLPWGMLPVGYLTYLLLERPDRLAAYKRKREIQPKHVCEEA